MQERWHKGRIMQEMQAAAEENVGRAKRLEQFACSESKQHGEHCHHHSSLPYDKDGL